MEMHFLFFVPFSVQRNVPNLKAATLAADRHANSSSNDEFHIHSKGSLYRYQGGKEKEKKEKRIERSFSSLPLVLRSLQCLGKEECCFSLHCICSQVHQVKCSVRQFKWVMT